MATARRRARPSPLAVAGELVLTLGVLVGLFLGYEFGWTNVSAHLAQRAAAAELDRLWASGANPPLRLGDPFAKLRIPRLGPSWERVVLEGVRLEDLSRGPTHYPQTAPPGAIGNFVVAGHRATNGEPFAHLDRLRPGDAVVVETATRRLTYRVDGHEIVPPTATRVLLPVPSAPGAVPTRARMTLQACHPRWGSSLRLIVYATLASTTPRVRV